MIRTRNTGGNWWAFECKSIESKQNRVFKYEMLGTCEALDSAASVMKDPKDILLIDLDNQGKLKTMTKEQIEKLEKGLKIGIAQDLIERLVKG
jgi:hypothetical protein